jgi:hypothetical protein
MKRFLGLSLLAVSSLSLQASLFTFSYPGGTADGGEEVPANGSAGSGLLIGLSYDDTSNTLSTFSGTYTGLGSNVTGSHIHGSAIFGDGAPGDNAGVFVALNNDGGTAGSLSSAAPSVLTEDQEANLLAGNFYVNVHTTGFPGGEIRGQLIPQLVVVPEPEAYAAMVGAGLVAFGVWRRVRK